IYVYPPPTADYAEDPGSLVQSRGSSEQGVREEHARSAALATLAGVISEEIGESAASVQLGVVADHDVGKALIERAGQAEMLVIGLRRRSRVGKFLLGSTAQEIILDAK